MRGVQTASAVQKACACGATFMTNGPEKKCYGCRKLRYKRSRAHYRKSYGLPVPPQQATHTTFLPFCVVCHCYPATLIAGVWKCGRHG